MHARFIAAIIGFISAYAYLFYVFAQLWVGGEPAYALWLIRHVDFELIILLAGPLGIAISLGALRLWRSLRTM
jgi:hypothetical protein